MVPSQRRFVFIDSLRGIAATGVMLCHLIGAELRPGLDRIFHPMVFTVSGNFNLAVFIFFAISGYVIAHSISPYTVNSAFCRSFVVRRIIRLDPPYWASIAMVIIGNAAAGIFFSRSMELPSATRLLSHAVYLQRVMDYGHLSGPYWTLCLEVQFYLFYLLIASFLQRAGRAPPLLVGLLVGLSCPSLLALVDVQSRANIVWLTPVLCTFFIGVAAFWASPPRATRFSLVAFIVLCLTMIITGIVRGDAAPVVAAVTAAALVVGAHRGSLTTWLSWPVLLYLGRISYSLYVVHVPVGARVVNLGARVVGSSAVGSVIVTCLAIAASIGAAEILYRLVERPSVNFAKRFKLPENASEPEATVPAPTTTASPPA